MNNLNFLKKSELLNIIAQELAYVAPVSWKRIVYYTERLPDLEIGLRNASISKCWVGVEEKLFVVKTFLCLLLQAYQVFLSSGPLRLKEYLSGFRVEQ